MFFSLRFPLIHLCYQLRSGLGGSRSEAGHSETIFDAVFHPGDPYSLFTVAFDGQLKHWDTRTATLDALDAIPRPVPRDLALVVAPALVVARYLHLLQKQREGLSRPAKLVFLA